MRKIVFDGLPEGTHTWGIRRDENGREVQFRIGLGSVLGWGDLENPQGYVDRGQAHIVEDGDE